MLFTPDRDLDPPNEPDTEETERCANCHEEEEVFELGIEFYGFKANDKICSFCYNDFCNYYSLTN